MSADDQPTGGEQGPNSPHSPSLDSNCDNPTRWEKRLSGPESEDSDSGGSDDWGRQQKRVFHRVNTLLHYWESRDYAILWVTLTSSPESDDADQLAYNLQRLRQTIERAELAKDGDGKGHRLSHITEIEQLCIRTSEGPEGKGVLHLFWAWKPPEGNHSRDFYIPQDWLAHQWGRIHGPHDEHSEEPVEPLWVSIERYGTEDYHDRKHVARYCVTQYLGEHAEALEHVSWSHGRTLGGSLTEAWKAVRKHRERLSEAIEAWETVIAGDPVNIGSQSEHVSYGLQVIPPPNLGVEVIEEVSVDPPEEWEEWGPNSTTIETVAPVPEIEDTDSRLCPECESVKGIHHLPEGHLRRDRDDTGVVEYLCVACKTEFAPPGEGGMVVVKSEMPDWDPATVEGPEHRQTKLWEFGDMEPCRKPKPDPESRTRSSGSRLLELSRNRTHEQVEDTQNRTIRDEVKEYVANNSGVSVPQVLGELVLSPDHARLVEDVLEARC